ncbi:MAG: PH domain-containing protein [Gammaproteobacteria bacterium]|nr:PH domain-containing protein [Gammaproteobacteria bacterium]
MSYISKTLLKNENILLQEKPHWIIFSSVLSWIVLAIIFWFLSGLLGFSSISIFSVDFPYIIELLFFVMAIFSFVMAYIIYISSEYVITDKRVLMKTGLINYHALELFYGKIESIYVNQTIGGRIFDYGTIVIRGTGGTGDHFSNVPKPHVFRRAVQQQMEDMEKSK